jgi:hypothetical protein
MAAKKTRKLKSIENEAPDINSIIQDTSSNKPETTPERQLPIPAIRETDLSQISSFYARVLAEAERLDFETAARTKGLDDEITLMRVKIKAILENHPDDIRLLVSASNILVRMVKTRHSMTEKQDKNLGEAITKIIRDIGVPLGVSVLNKKL